MAGVRQFDEREALGLALEVFGTRGFRGASMLDLAAGTGVKRGSLYHHYGGKEEIFLRVFRDHSRRFLEGAAEALGQPDKRAALLAFFEFCIRSITVGSPSRGCLSTRTAIDASTEAPQVERAVSRFLDDLESVVYNGLTAISDGVEMTVDARDAARLVVTTTRGLAVMERLHVSRAQLKDIAATLVTALTRG